MSMVVQTHDGHAQEIVFPKRESKISLERLDDDVAIVRGVTGALSVDMARDIRTKLWEAENDVNVRVTILEIMKVQGANIKEFPPLSKTYTAQEIANIWQSLAREIPSFRKPVIAAVSGYAYGGGCELMLMSDFIVVEVGAKLKLPELSLGIMPGGGGTQTLARRVGILKALWVILSSREIKVAQPLVDDLATDSPVEGAIHAIAKMVIKKRRHDPIAWTLSGWCAGWMVTAVAFLTWWGRPPASFWLARRAIMHGNMHALGNGGLRNELDSFVKAFGTEDAREGIGAFLGVDIVEVEKNVFKVFKTEKRKPHFRGK